MRKLPERKMPPERTEGYWYSSTPPATAYPMPEARIIKWRGQKEFIDKLRWVEEDQALSRKYKGWSTCRICGDHNGSSEYTLKGKHYIWSWPSGLAHYIEDHNVKPSRDFRKFILEAAA